MDFRAIANTAFDDLLLLRKEAWRRRGDLGKDVERAVELARQNPDTLPDCQDTLVRLDLMTRAEAMARTQDLGCHVLAAIDTNRGL